MCKKLPSVIFRVYYQYFFYLFVNRIQHSWSVMKHQNKTSTCLSLMISPKRKWSIHILVTPDTASISRRLGAIIGRCDVKRSCECSKCDPCCHTSTEFRVLLLDSCRTRKVEELSPVVRTITVGFWRPERFMDRFYFWSSAPFWTIIICLSLFLQPFVFHTKHYEKDATQRNF